MAYFVHLGEQTQELSDIPRRRAIDMNWELSGASKHKCPCGQGTYTIRIFLDDWNRSEEQWDMDCIKCRRKYDLCSTTIPKSGRLLRTNRWVRKGDSPADGLSLVGKDAGQRDRDMRKQLEGVKAPGFALQMSKSRIV